MPAEEESCFPYVVGIIVVFFILLIGNLIAEKNFIDLLYFIFVLYTCFRVAWVRLKK